ncbi:glycosyltransferase family 2 protein [Priestia megaterium]|uniref:Glycosyltransferase family 2 protein n=1 Tax=Priestia megaterium TaxID=1404 RepID=A0A6H1PAU2_PRIMG|nr:glycosyltransferase [Priestia megaterium]QIZ10663.1 glycosyltransferase family 2 protein [Priestia megaterium]
MISIIACTNREKFVSNIIANFQKQTLREKELILVLNSSKMNFKQIERELEETKLNSQLIQFPDEMSLGECLNKGAERANFEYLGKMDDDDYYGNSYLTEAFEALTQTKAEVVGKSSFYIYFKKKQELRLYNPHHENSWIINNGQNLYKTAHFLSGATLIFKKDLLKKIAFPHVNQGEDSGFQRRCFEKHVKMYSLSKDHYVYVRSGLPHHHTSDATERMLRSRSRLVIRTPSIETFFDT